MSMDVKVYDNGDHTCVKDVFHNWATEILGAGVHIHSKVIVLDPFGDKPVVMTGSHNLGYKASTANDDNLMIIEGNAPLAAAYAVNIIAIYQAYRWNAYVEAHRQDPKVWHGLVDNDSWQDSFLAGEDLAEIRFWLGLHRAAAGMTVASSVAGVPVHTTPVADDEGPAPGKTSSAKKTTGARKKASVKKKPVKKAAARKKAPAKRKAPAKKKKAATKNKRAAKAKAKKSNRR